MAEKATGKAQGRSRPQAQAKGKGNQRQGKQGPDSGRGGGGSAGGARGAANGTAARRGGEQRGQQSGNSGQERNRPRSQEQEPQQDEQQEQQQDLSQDSGGGKVGDTLKQHPFTTAALGAGLTLLAAQGLRMALGGSGGNAQARGGEGEEEDEDSSGQASFLDADEEEEGEEEDDDARGASASDEEDEEGSEEDEDEEDAEEGGFTSRLRQGVSRVGSALGGSGGAIRRGAQSGFQRGRQAADQNWHNHPLVMCGVALAVGAAAGFMLPRTRQEDRLMGETADKVTGRLKKAMTDSFRQGRTVAGKVVHEAVNATAKEAEREGLTPDRLGKKVKRLVSHVREAVSNAVEEE